MNFKEEIKKRGLKQTWIAEQLGINPSTLTVYINVKDKMPTYVEDKLRAFLK